MLPHVTFQRQQGAAETFCKRGTYREDPFLALHHSGEQKGFCSQEVFPGILGKVSVLIISLKPKLSAAGSRLQLKPVAAPACSGSA